MGSGQGRATEIILIAAIRRQPLEAVERRQRDEGHDQPRPDGRAAVRLYRVQHFGGFSAHGGNLPPKRRPLNTRGPLVRQIGDPLTISSRFAPQPSIYRPAPDKQGWWA